MEQNTVLRFRRLLGPGHPAAGSDDEQPVEEARPKTRARTNASMGMGHRVSMIPEIEAWEFMGAATTTRPLFVCGHSTTPP